jgi:hypothetical protein
MIQHILIVCHASVVTDCLRSQKAFDFSLFQIFLDSTCHQILAGSTWLTFVGLHKKNSKCSILNYPINSWIYFVLSLFFGFFVDIDHFIAAKSFSIYNATHLQNRPFGHCLLLIIAIMILLIILIPKSFREIPIIFTLGTLSHIIRDSSRRGIYIMPYATTPPIHYVVHLVLLTILPYAAYHFISLIQQNPVHETEKFQKSLKLPIEV